MGMATVLGVGMAWWWGWGFGAALTFGLSLSCASTVVLVKTLDARGVLETMNGRIAVGWLVRSEEHTSELQSLMRISYAVFCLKKKSTKLTTYYENRSIH